MKYGELSYYQRLLKDLHTLEAKKENLSSSLAFKLEFLKFHVSYFFPFLDFDPRISIPATQRNYDEWLQQDLGAVEIFFNNELRYLRREMYAPSMFYAAEYMGSPALKFMERVSDHLECVETNLCVSINEFLRAFDEGLNNLYGFLSLINKYEFLELILFSEVGSHIIYVSKLLPEKVRYMFEKFIEFGDETVLQELGDYLDTIKNAQLQAEMVYLEALQIMGVGQIETCCFECETLCNFIDDLQYIVDDLPSLMEWEKLRDIRMELKFIRSFFNHLLVESLKDRCCVVDAISTHIEVWAADVIDDLDFGETEKLKDAQLRLSGVRNSMRKINGREPVEGTGIDDFLKIFMLLVKDSVLTCPVIKNQLRELELLHTLLQHAENLNPENGELSNMCQHIKLVFREGLWNLQSYWVSRYRKNCPMFLEELMSEMPKTNEFLVTLINSISSLLVKVKSDATIIVPVRHFAEIFIQEVAILRCIHINLQTQYWKEEESATLSQDIKVVGTEAMRTYSLLLKDLDGDIQSSMVERLECFKASVRQLYLKFVKLPPSNIMLSNSEVVFREMLGHLKEFKESGVAERSEYQLGVFYDSLSVCSSFVSQHIFKNNEPEDVMHILRTQIIKMGRKVENFIEAFEMIPDWFFEMWLFDLMEEVKMIKEEVSKLSIMTAADTEGALSHGKAHKETNASEEKEGLGDEHNHPAKTQEVMLGFEKLAEQLRSQLTVGPQQQEVISIFGMPGIGKTSLALNVYNGCANSFHAHAWCYVSQDFQRKELLQNIITQINGKPSSNELGEEDLAIQLKKILLSKNNYLIVLDDIWDINSWNALKQSFPPGNKRSRILVTSRYKTVALEINCEKVHELGLLDAHNSWRLLLNRVFGARICPPRLLEVGKVIANRCKGLPLSIVVIAGILKNTEMSEDKWNEVAESVESHLVIDQDSAFSTLELSYNHLSYPLKRCFLYCGALVKGKEIPRSKLVQLWCAERFSYDSHQQSQERVAEKYLSDLVDRSLLMVAQTSFNKQIRTCRIHDLLGDFAIHKATEDKFLVSANRCTYFTSLQGRLCLTSFPFGRFAPEYSVATKSLARSLFITADLPDNDIPNPDKAAVARFFGRFKSLFILDLENIGLSDSADNDFYKAIGDMNSLRYLAIRSQIKTIPSSFGHLLNLETLIIRNLFSGIKVPDFIFNLTRLRHLRLPTARFNGSRGNISSCNSLQSFGTPNLNGHTADWLFARLPNLIKLSCKFHNCESIDLSILTCLESLKVTYSSKILYSDKLRFPLSLRKLTLHELSLPWCEIDRIAPELPQLEELKLLGANFEGLSWNTSGSFQNLKFFSLDHLKLQIWKASEDNFPSLERLIVQSCWSLVSIPKAFGKIVNLNGIEIYKCNTSVVKSAMKIKRMQIADGNMLFEAIVPGYEDDNNDYADSDDDDDDDDDGGGGGGGGGGDGCDGDYHDEDEDDDYDAAAAHGRIYFQRFRSFDST